MIKKNTDKQPNQLLPSKRENEKIIEKKKFIKLQKMITIINQTPVDAMLDQHFLLSIEKADHLLELFLLMGADPNANNNYAMSYMANKGNLEAVKLLHQYGGNINIDLSKAIKQNHFNVVNYILEQMSEEEKENLDPIYLKIAISNKYYNMVQLLINYIEVTSTIMKIASRTSANMIELLLPHTAGKLPIDTFAKFLKEGYSPWYCFKSLPLDVLILLENYPKIISDIVTKAECDCLGRTFSNYLVDCFREELNKTFQKAFSNVTLNNNLMLLKQHFSKLWEKLICPASPEEFSYIWRNLSTNLVDEYSKKLVENDKKPFQYFSLNTFEILEITISHKCLRIAIEGENIPLIQSLLRKHILPTEDDILLACQNVTYCHNIIDETAFQILNLLFYGKLEKEEA